MAKIGAQDAWFAPFDDADTETAAATYENGFKIAALMEASDSPNYASAEIYGDDVLDDSVEEFTEGDVTVKGVELTDDHAAVLYGITAAADGSLGFPSENAAPYGGLGYVQKLRRQGTVYYRAFFFPKVKAQVSGNQLVTKNKNLSFDGETVNFKAYAPKTVGGLWKYTYESTVLVTGSGSSSPVGALSWLKAKLNITA